MRERLSEMTRWLDEHRRVAVTVGVTIPVVVVLAVIAIVFTRTNPVDDHAYDDPILSINDIPARTFIGWEELDVEGRPETAATPDRMRAPDNSQCVPGGSLQTDVQKMVVSGDKWSGSRFVNPGAGQVINVQLSNSTSTDPAVIDGWLEACTQTRLVVDDGAEQQLRLASLPISPAFYRLDDARVYAVTVAGDRATTTLYGWGRAGDVTVQVDYTFAGEPTDNAIAQFDVVWRAQAGKLVGMQEAGLL
ncbi:hypothetical protein [Prescottella subtropica]|uniref:hypothetical protein n=1 Tax=Prescottella subtropica TaxID=2545757 RepID=UPI0010F95719|nr:hypothetical protein [Prescottella subtropica]